MSQATMTSNGFISPRASIAGTAFIGNNVRVFGAATIGPHCYLDDNVVIGYPSKEALTLMIKKGNVPTDLSELDKYADNQTVISGRCCVRYGSVISVGSFLDEEVYCDVRTQVGANCRIGKRTQLLYGALIYNDVMIGADCRVGGFCCNRSVIEDNVSMFGELVHAYRKPVGGLIEASPVIRKSATVGWQAIIIGGIEIGEDSYVTAGATVTKNIQPRYVVVGHEAISMPLDTWSGSLADDL